MGREHTRSAQRPKGFHENSDSDETLFPKFIIQDAS
jgi:hypothetical protein